jgi:uncharacterized protein YecT (DUF1311 family)
MGYALIRLALAVVAALIASPAWAQASKQAAADSNAIQDCVKTNTPPGKDWERCIGRVSNKCLDDAKSTADQNACIDREQKVWDDILNETYRRLREKLDQDQQVKLRDMQRAWLASREKTCAFYWDFYQGTMASPMTSSCVNRETARRALFLLGFLNEAEGK